MQQQKNLLLFILASLLIIIGWSQFQLWMWPPKPRSTAREQQPAARTSDPRPKPPQPPVVEGQVFAALISGSALASPGLDGAAPLLVRASLAAPLLEQRWPWRHQPAFLQRQVIASLAAGSSPPVPTPSGSVLAEVALAEWKQNVKWASPVVLPPHKTQEFALGGDSFNLRVILSTRGGTIRQVVLDKFQKADKMGLPVFKDHNQKVPEPLELLPRSRSAHGDRKNDFGLTEPLYHYPLYHYAQGTDERPLETLGEIEWKVESVRTGPGADIHEVVLSTPDDVPGLPVRITKKYTLQRQDYHVGLEVMVQNRRLEKQAFRYQVAGARGLPIEGEWYATVYRMALAGWFEKGRPYRHLEDARQLSLWEGGDKLERGESSDKIIRYAATAVQYFASALVVDNQQPGGGEQNFLGRVRATLEQSALRGQITRIEENSFVLRADREYTFQVPKEAAALRAKLNHGPRGTTVVVWRPKDDQRIAVDLLDSTMTNTATLDDITVRAVTEAIPLAPHGSHGDTVTHRYLIYNGPVKVRLLGHLEGDRAVPPELVQRYEDTLNLGTLADYQSPGWGGSFARSIGLTWLVIKCTNLMHGLIWVLHSYVFPWSYGICIILLTVLVRGLMFPISRRQAKISQEMQDKMAKLAPDMKKIREKYKDDFAALSQAQQELYRRHGINPFATLGGCLLLLAQMPIFMGLYYALQESIFLRLAPFFSWLSWMPNLAAPDMLMSWLPGNLALSERIPWITTPESQGSMIYLGPYFNLLPVVAVALMMVQQKLMTPPPTDEQQEMQQKMMKYMMVFFGIMFYKVPAGLCVYFIASSLWGLAERKFIGKGKLATVGGKPLAQTPTAAETNRKPAPEATSEKRVDGWLQKVKDRWDNLLEQASKQQQARREPLESDSPKKKKRKR
jgi:YidC/Oxa1 family membrane protein insertase